MGDECKCTDTTECRLCRLERQASGAIRAQSPLARALGVKYERMDRMSRARFEVFIRDLLSS